ncbi:hypothetical protein FDK21_03575 [Cohaesibacter sp. CAU 1516]|uniref:hypothetical protein n=1 Tax=Cohaesibacter sp. CAU 1516 TaxID=2576038 RepID=UPI0010FEBF01|nr:hypothetical protein [Cohaesibacter sp. CAU 1516]TLP48751.1 hypothetical protein FDK21_03575 [Cohaesibacter sp. CAU 1516]
MIEGNILSLPALIGGIIVRCRNLSKQIRDGDDRLHERVNRIRDEYVRRDDLHQHIGRIDQGLKDMRDESRQENAQINRRLDDLLAKLSGS